MLVGVTTWNLDQHDGTLTLLTGVTGRAARMGHRLTIAMDSWRISVTGDGDTPTSARLIVDVDSLRVLSGTGGLTPLTGPEKTLIRGNALKTLSAKRFPTIEFDAQTITATDTGYRLAGPLTLHGVTRDIEVPVEVTDGRLSARATVSHKDFGIRPYSMAMGSMKVADEVVIEFSAALPAH
ncbi:hypothetical protein MCHIJ_33250 [Mycolicibacterium chitae]|uniref:S-adenosyl-L-methionine-dependent methyltransferase n=2 Tax=Mycolicibacterium TaxID=1866885 RepID=A0A3S4S8Q4_MYCCI|nr:hypothetical protein MCHIJ_33250 [Mycolicibacterium chitae]VEG47539.1 Putative S-adenosyl-L-methionine-dependent methyltransferase [Mycolicibacterium chitae]